MAESSVAYKLLLKVAQRMRLAAVGRSFFWAFLVLCGRTRIPNCGPR